MREYNNADTFSASKVNVEKELFEKALDVITKAN